TDRLGPVKSLFAIAEALLPLAVEGDPVSGHGGGERLSAIFIPAVSVPRMVSISLLAPHHGAQRRPDHEQRAKDPEHPSGANDQSADDQIPRLVQLRPTPGASNATSDAVCGEHPCSWGPFTTGSAIGRDSRSPAYSHSPAASRPRDDDERS